MWSSFLGGDARNVMRMYLSSLAFLELLGAAVLTGDVSALILAIVTFRCEQ